MCEHLLQDTDQSKISSAILCGSAVLEAALISTEVIHRRTCLRCFLALVRGSLRKLSRAKVLLNIWGSLSWTFLAIIVNGECVFDSIITDGLQWSGIYYFVVLLGKKFCLLEVSYTSGNKSHHFSCLLQQCQANKKYGNICLSWQTRTNEIRNKPNTNVHTKYVKPQILVLTKN